MSVALKVYEQLTDAGEDKARARAIAEAFEALEDRYPEIKELATQSHVREGELRLQKEIEGVRLEIKEVEGKLRKEIEGVRLEIKEVEGRLQKEIESVRLEIKSVEVRLVTAMHRQTLWVVGSVGAIVGLIRLMDFFLNAMLPH
ncbi:MAG: DUF1640 domain-containing protein [Gammaproteobacteria bacterium]|nr:DUF1640 domain-containing protein [Gammaproteobacteria bacterium]MBU1655470.1 DUF1640 domain-containing protein [Gammaproteobacteria bacterium]MBU1959605.1 DUF1640 domain-containing protein [Gammaproteobacteria bacterium]